MDQGQQKGSVPGQEQPFGNMEERVRFMLQQNPTPPSNNQTAPQAAVHTVSPHPHNSYPQHQRAGQVPPNTMNRNNRGFQQQQSRPNAAGNLPHGSSLRGSTARGPRQHQTGRGHSSNAHPHSGPRRGDFGPNNIASPRQQGPYGDRLRIQCEYLESLVKREAPHLEVSPREYEAKERFRNYLEQILQQVVQDNYPPQPADVKLVCFGSVASGFDTPGSDMDLALVALNPLPDALRHFEKLLLDFGLGARLLTKTRVPILKICEHPTQELFAALCEERSKWDHMTEEERYDFEHPTKKIEIPGQDPTRDSGNDLSHHAPSKQTAPQSNQSTRQMEHKSADAADDPNSRQRSNRPSTATESAQNLTESMAKLNVEDQTPEKDRKGPQQSRPKKQWYREKALGALDFPKDGVGIQCDVNEENRLGIHNTALLRCYSHCDPRVKLMVLFVKAWASRRKINSARYGTLSSYGYVLMVLHYLVNVTRPAVCPNLQLTAQNQPNPSAASDQNICNGFLVQFWRDEAEIKRLAANGELTQNRQPIGLLLRNFFRYYADQGFQDGVQGFVWTQKVLSLRTPGGILTKEQKGWTGAKVTVQDNVEVRHRYLFAIEDPFETTHNVARPVTHNGIVAIRDEFRRAWRILCQIGSGSVPEGELLDEIVSEKPADEDHVKIAQQPGNQTPDTTTPIPPETMKEWYKPQVGWW